MIMSSRPTTLAAACIDSPDSPEAHLVVIARKRYHETNLPNASDAQALRRLSGVSNRRKLDIADRADGAKLGERPVTIRPPNREVLLSRAGCRRLGRETRSLRVSALIEQLGKISVLNL
jgi:hypothetical protein